MGGSSNVGVLATGVFRDQADDAFTGGVDYNLRWDQNRVNWNGHWAATRAPGDEGLQTSGGGVTNFNVQRKHWGLWSHFDHFGRDFRINDIGFFRARADRTEVNGGFNLEQPDPGRLAAALRREHLRRPRMEYRRPGVRQVAVHQRERDVPELLERQRRPDAAVRDLRRPRHARRPADPESGGLLLLLQRRH